MAISLLQLLLLFLLLTNFTTQSPQGTNYSCSTDTLYPCQTYVAYFAQSPSMMNLANISALFGVTPLLIASASNLVSEDVPLVPNQLLLVPINCKCIGNSSFANITYQIKQDDSFYSVSTTLLGNLTDWQLAVSMNPGFEPILLHPGDRVNFPLFCKCPSSSNLENGIRRFITYVWQPKDDVFKVAAKLNATAYNIVTENNYSNFTTAVYKPVVVPVSQLPILSQPNPFSRNTKSHKWIILMFSSFAGALLAIILISVFVWGKCSCKKKKTLDRNDSHLETSDLIRMKKYESFEAKMVHDKLFTGVSSYLCKPIVYDSNEIIRTTMDLHEHYRIGGSVYRAEINGQILAVKKPMDEFSEELQILQKVSHANLVKLMGVAFDEDRVSFMVYEFAENGSLDKWLHSSGGSLSWGQRLQIALDVASGLQYMHEHIQPSIVHMDIRTSNIVLDSTFKAKIANFSKAKLTADPMLLKVDVFSFGAVLLELLCGKKGMVTKENGEIFGLENGDEKIERVKKLMDPNLGGFYPVESAVSLMNLAWVCTLDQALERPSMAEIVFHLTVLTQTSSEVLERSWTCGLEAEVIQITSPVAAR